VIKVPWTGETLRQMRCRGAAAQAQLDDGKVVFATVIQGEARRVRQ
jgi:hypothetical protein